jgi:hypothetical protein
VVCVGEGTAVHVFHPVKLRLYPWSRVEGTDSSVFPLHNKRGDLTVQIILCSCPRELTISSHSLCPRCTGSYGTDSSAFPLHNKRGDLMWFRSPYVPALGSLHIKIQIHEGVRENIVLCKVPSNLHSFC